MNPIIILTVKVPVHWTPQEFQMWFDWRMTQPFEPEKMGYPEMEFIGTQMVRVYEMEIKN